MSLDNPLVQSPELAPQSSRMMQYGAQLLIAGSTLLGVHTVLSESGAQAQESRQLSEAHKEMMKKEVREKLATAPVPQLLEWMNSPIYDIRVMSTEELRTRAAAVFKETGKFPEEIVDFIENRREFPPEVRRRLAHLSTEFAQLEQVRMLSGTNIKFPKKEMTVREWLACISKQIERPVNFYGEVKLNDEIIQTKDGLMWEVVGDATLRDGQKFIYYSASPTEVNLHVGKPEGILTATNGAISAQLDTEIGRLRYVVEPKVDMQTFRILAIRQRDEKGQWNTEEATPSKPPTLPKYIKPGKPFYAEVDIEVRAFRMKKFDIHDPKLPQEISAGGFAFHYKGLAPKTDDLGHHLATLQPERECPNVFMEKTKCAAFTATGEPQHIPATYSSQDEVTWSFGTSRPGKVSLFIPLDKPSDDVPTRKVTLVFKRD